MLEVDIYQEDKFQLEYMLDRVIVAKLIQVEAKEVPDNFIFYQPIPVNYMSMDIFTDTIMDFLTYSKIGKFKYFDEDNGDMISFSIRLYLLEELFRFELTKEDKEEINQIFIRFTELGMEDFSNWDGSAKRVGCFLFYKLFFIHGMMNEFCMDLITVNRKLKKLLDVVKTRKRGEK